MGIVYEGRHVALGSPVAIKIVRPELAEQPGPLSLFLHEARATAMIRSEHAVRVFDLGRLESGAPFLVMERLEGVDLGKLLTLPQRPHSTVVVDYLIDACAGLASAHALGLVHRDIKPSNLFLDRRAGPPGGLVKVLDFGASKWLWSDPMEGHGADVRASVGSPAYQSPEQLANPYEVDQRSDIWSLGAVLYELLTGRRAFSAPDMKSLYHLVLHGEAPRLNGGEQEFDAELCEVVRRCLEKDRGRRFANVDDLSEALAPFGSQRRAAPASLPGRCSRRRNPECSARRPQLSRVCSPLATNECVPREGSKGSNG